MIIGIGTTNKAKIAAVHNGFAELMNEKLTFEAYKTESGVREQPFSDEETIKGAINRATSVLEIAKADIGIGLEGGVVSTEFGTFLCNWGALAEKGRRPVIAGGARILLPDSIDKRLLDEELGSVMDDFCQKEGIRQHEGAMGIFTNGAVKRDEMFQHTVKLLVGQWQYQKGFPDQDDWRGVDYI
jgi:inosine/xanthosine triphosphatase